MTSQETVSLLKKIQPEAHKRFKVKIIGIFGSAARNENTELSDIDILVEFETGATLFDLSALKIYLEEKLNKKVDVVSKKALRKEIEPNIFSDLILV